MERPGLLRFLTAGESHGPALAVIVEGMPAGLPLDEEWINHQLARRQAGYGRGRRMQIERDRVEILAGVRHGLTLGSPIALRIANRDYANWEAAMSPHPPSHANPVPGQEGHEGQAEGDNWRLRPVTRPRPGHADLAGAMKFAFTDLRNVLERASARETAARVAAGAVARRLLEELGIRVGGHVRSIGSVRSATVALDGPETDVAALVEAAERSPVRCADPAASGAMVQAIDEARARGDSLGGVFEVVADGVPPGLGSYTHWDRRLDGRLAQALMSIPGVKAVEVGCGFDSAVRFGSELHDPIHYGPVPRGQYRARPDGIGFFRSSNRAGGLEGGVTTGQPVVVRAAVKPIATLMQPLPSVDLVTREPARAAIERSDVCVVPSAVVVGEAMVAWVLAQAVLEKFGGDSLGDLTAALELYRRRLGAG